MRIKKKIYQESDIYTLVSIDSTAKLHCLFLEWDEPVTKDMIRVLVALKISGILIKSPRGNQFISVTTKTNLQSSLAIQRIFRADPQWVLHNKKRGFSSLRISIKYGGEKPLQVIPYPLTDTDLKDSYESAVERYFYQGNPYMLDSSKEDEDEEY